MKKFEIKFIETDRGIKCSSNAEGFSGLELIGLLKMKEEDLANQLYHPEQFERHRND